MDNWEVYNNVFAVYPGRIFSVGCMIIPSGASPAWKVYNNTFVGSGDTSNSNLGLQIGGSHGSKFENNVLTGFSTYIYGALGVGSISSATLNYNIYAAKSGTAPMFDHNGTTYSTFAAWQAYAGEANSSQPSSAGIDSLTGIPTSGSAIINAGTNLTSEAIFTTDILGNPRAASGPWDVGAYDFQGGRTSTSTSSGGRTATSTSKGGRTATIRS